MIELIKTNLELCVGCNRCIRECHMEMANVTYQDEAGNIKVKTDHAKCIGCGRCIAVCKHGAREYKDDTARFFEDLAAGVPISLIAAPSIQTNIPEYGRLFTYLKNKGVRKIYDASLGADICIWAHVRHIEQNESVPLITQPCPAIVLYCEIYRRDLLGNLAPIHSPMACAAIYMKNYEGITDNIAAVSPCIAKSAEFADTQLTQYNVTFEKLLQYIKNSNVELPIKETGFDHDESGLGALFPLPGGLKENIEYHLGRKINISKAEGAAAYHKLNIYAETPVERLPEIFDVLSCAEGCNIGPAVANERNIFDIDAVMNKKRNAATDESRKKHFEALYQVYDKKFDRSHFMRQYRAWESSFPIITDQDIANAFELLGKTDDEKQHVDCGACGSETCRNMARKIALGVNIPINCIVKMMEDAKREHEENLVARNHSAYLEHLREADERTRIMLDTTPIGAQFWDKNINVIDCNQETLRLFNVPSKQEYLNNFYAYFPEYQPDGRSSKEASVEIVKKVFKDGYQRHEWMCRTLDGALIPTEVTLVRVDYKGDYLVAAYTRDLREQKQMMREIDDGITQLKETQLTVAAMFDANPHINILIDSNFKLLDCNPAALRFMGFETKEEMFAGFMERMTQSIPKFQPDGRASISMAERLVTAANEGLVRFETELVVGGERWHLNVELKRIPYEGSFAIVCYVFDLTDMKKMSAQLEVALKEAEAASKAKSEFLSKMSHEIRTPMNAILGITEIQLRNESLVPETKDALDKIYSAGDLLLGIINDVLDLSKIEAGKFELVSSKYEIASLINDVVTLNMMRIGSKPIEFKLSVDENIPARLLGDELRIKQILNNILSNAIKYTAKGSVMLSVYAESKNNDDVMLFFKVRDTGLGMTEEQLKFLFEAYTRFHAEGNYATEGTGLGMNITKNLVHLMNGEIFVESVINKGSCFTVQLPQQRIGTVLLGRELVENLQNFRANGIKQIKRARIVFEQMPDARVLVVDDVESNLYVAKGLLAPYGLSVDTAISGYAAIDRIKKGNVYDVIFMDHMMPKMDGIEATRIIRSLGYEAPIVALTANVVTGQADIFLANGFDDFVPKPIDVRLLNAVLKKFIKNKLSRGTHGIGAAAKQGTSTTQAPPKRHEAMISQKPDRADAADKTAKKISLEPKLVEFFLKDAQKAVASLETIHERRDAYDAEDIRTYTVSVHGMKSALAYIGETELSAFAGKLEKAGRENNTAVMSAETSAFLGRVKALIEKLTPQKEQPEETGETVSEDHAYLREKLLLIKDACEVYDKKTAKNTLAELRQKTWQSSIKEPLDAMAEHLLGGDFEEVLSIADSIMKSC